MVKQKFISHTTAESAFEHIRTLYDQSVQKIQHAFSQALQTQSLDKKMLEQATYPYIRLSVPPEKLISPMSPLAAGIVHDPGTYGTTLTRPDLFKDYYLAQIQSLIDNHQISVEVGPSAFPIPMLYAVRDDQLLGLSEKQRRLIETVFPPLDLRQINDDIANSTQEELPFQERPLSLFTAKRVDYSLDRLHHYTGTNPKFFQKFILLTNYQRYVDVFLDHAREQLAQGKAFDFKGPEDKDIDAFKRPAAPKVQMPAYHLIGPDKSGITFINIGVGPSNAKTITDHLAVLRPHCWIMVGHCAGLRHNQMLGDYVLAHAYMRDDRVLDLDVPLWVPIPTIAEIQMALRDSIKEITGLNGNEYKLRVRTGTVASTCDRNWELNTKEFYVHLRQSRAIAIDMESATLATNGFRFRVPYGTLLCVSDKPVHGEIKMRGMANAFYKKSIHHHMLIGLKTIELLKKRGVQHLHSRKLRGFFEAPFE